MVSLEPVNIILSEYGISLEPVNIILSEYGITRACQYNFEWIWYH